MSTAAAGIRLKQRTATARLVALVAGFAGVGAAASMVDRLAYPVLAAMCGLLFVRTAHQAAAAPSAPAAPADLDLLFRRASELVTVVAPDGTVRYQSPSIESILGWEADDVVGGSLFELVHGGDLRRWQQTMARVATGLDDEAVVRSRARHRDGTWRWMETTIADLTDEPGVGGFVLSSHDISDRVALEEQLRRNELHDGLTGLANRTLFRDRLEEALAVSQRRGRTVAIVRFDLDDFRSVNEGRSTELGDRVLVAVADALRSNVRDGDVVARLDGDEFAVLLDRNDSEADAVATAQRLLNVLKSMRTVDDVELSVRASAGIATAIGAVDAGEMLRNAEVAMHTAKRAGKDQHKVFRPEMHAAVIDRMGLECDLRDALHRDELVLHYQPIVGLGDEGVIGVEALLRWNHPTRGMVQPGTFIPLAEETGLIVPIGAWLLRRAIETVAAWTTSAGEPLHLSVNLSARQLADDGLVEDIRTALAVSGFDPARLTLEITESMLLEGAGPAIARLHALKALGLRLAIDDFGTGYSSLSYLKQLPVDELKVDRSFVDQLDVGAKDDGLVRTILALADSFGLETVAEGVERPRQVEMLRSMGCRRAQGFLFARPLAAEEIPAAWADPLATAVDERHGLGPGGLVVAEQAANR